MPFRSLLRLFLAVLLIGFACVAHGQPIRIMVMGDSQTEGFQGHASYRYALWFKLVNAGFDVDFVGGRTGAFHALTPGWYPNYETTFDRDHEGYSGIRTDLLASLAEARAETYSPQVLLLLAGSNDVGQFGSAAAQRVDENLREIIINFRAHLPGIVVLLGKILPFDSTVNSGCCFGFNYNARAQYVNGVNDAIAQVAANMNTAQSPVHLVDHHSGFNLNTMLQDDGLHANRAGEEWLAQKWFATLRNVLLDIEPQEPGEAFAINAGLNDAWYNTATAGQGFFITVFPDIEMMFLAWFTYDTERPDPGAVANIGEPGHRWLTAFGAYAGNVAELDVELTAGGVFDAAQPETSQQAGYGTIQLEFHDCNDASLNYEIPGQGLVGMIELQRIANDNVALCETLDDAVQAQ